MSYRARGKERKIKGIMMKILSIFRFRSIHLQISEKIILLGSSLLFISLFQKWVINNDSEMSWNSFSSISGNIGYPLIVGIILIFFSILSKNNKNKLKLHSNISFQNYSLIGFFGIFSIISTIIALSFIHGYDTFSKDIIYGNGVILGLTSGIIITVGSYVMRSHYKNKKIEVFVSESGEIKEKISTKNNMTLPF